MGSAGSEAEPALISNFLLQILSISVALDLIFVRILPNVPKGAIGLRVFDAARPTVHAWLLILSILIVALLIHNLPSTSKLDRSLIALLTADLAFTVTLALLGSTPLPEGFYNIFLMATVLVLLYIFVSHDRSKLSGSVAVFIGLVFVATFLRKADPLLRMLKETAILLRAIPDFWQSCEIAAILASFLLFYFYYKGRGEKWWSLEAAAMATLTAGLLTVAFLRDLWALSFLLGSSLGFGIYLGFEIYAVALWLYVYTLARLMRLHLPQGYGMLLLLLSGRSLTSPSLNLAAITALVVLLHPWHKR